MQVTWQEFKRRVEAHGVTDEAQIQIVDYDPNHTFSGIECLKTADGQWIIQNETY